MNNLGKNWLEWSVFGASSLLLLILMGFLGWSAYKHTGEAANIVTRMEAPVKVGNTWQVRVEIENKGDHASEGVEVEIEWKAGKQTANFTLPYAPRAGKRSGYAVFQILGQEKLAISDLEARIVGYEEG